MSEDFGNSWRHLKKALLFGGGIGAVVLVAVPAAAWLDGRAPDYTTALGGSLLAALVVPLLTAVTLVFSIRIEDGTISQRVFRHGRLRQGCIEDLLRVEIGLGRAAARLCFADGARVSLPMADERELQALCVHLMERRPGFANFVFSPRAARVEKVVQAFRAASAHPVRPAERLRHDRAQPGSATRAIPWGGLRRSRMV